MSDRTRSFFARCRELSASSPHSGARTLTDSAAAYYLLHLPRSASRIASSSQPYANHAACQTQAAQNPVYKDFHPAVPARLPLKHYPAATK